MTLRGRVRELEQRAATVPVNSAEYHAAAARELARLQYTVRGFLAAIREGGEPLPGEITAEIEQDRATVAAGCIAGEVEREAARFHLLMARTAANLRESTPANEARLAPADPAISRADAEADIESGDESAPVGPAAMVPVPVEWAVPASRVWNLSEMPRRGVGPHWLRSGSQRTE